jgi:hypothetical protein
MGANPFLLILLLAILGYFVLYFTGRKYLENFKEHQPDEILNQTVYPPEKPYLTSPINDLDDYELSVIFQNQTGKEASQKQISDAMSRYPMDWSVQPPNSQYFEDNQKEYLEKQKKKDAETERIRNIQYFAIAALGLLVLAVLIITFIQWRNNKHKLQANILLQQQKKYSNSCCSSSKSK